MLLDPSIFKKIVENTPLISIDLCIVDGERILLGKRNNPPAKNYFFVPGGRIRKDESINDSFNRILKDEVSAETIDSSRRIFLGVYQHFYKNNFLNTTDFSTHYIVLAFKIEVEDLYFKDKHLPIIQHSKYIWHEFANENNAKFKIHKYTKAYFNKLINS